MNDAAIKQNQSRTQYQNDLKNCLELKYREISLKLKAQHETFFQYFEATTKFFLKINHPKIVDVSIVHGHFYTFIQTTHSDSHSNIAKSNVK